MNKKMNILKNKNGTAILLTLFLLSGMLVVVLSAASIIVSGIKMSRTQTQSTKAFFAAEAGAERALWEIRKNAAGSANFSATLDNGSNYLVESGVNGAEMTVTSAGLYMGARRTVEVSFQFE